MPNTLQQFLSGMQGMGNIRAQQQQEQMRQAEFDRFTNIQNLRSMAQGAMEARGITDPVKQDAYLRARISNIKARGGDPRDTIEALQTPFEKRGQIYDNVIHIAERMGAIDYLPRDMRAGVDVSTGAGKGFAPDIGTYVNQQTGETLDVNTRDPQARDAAMKAGFAPVGPRERGYGVEIGKEAAKRETEIVKGAGKARGTLSTLNTMKNLLGQFRAGKFAKAGKELQQYVSALGLQVDVKGLAAKEAFHSMAEQLALQSRNMGEGMVLAGQMSDKDVQFLRDMNPQLVLTDAGNRAIIKIRSKIAQRQIDIAKDLREFKKRMKGRFDPTEFEGFVQEKYSNKNMFDDKDTRILTGRGTTGTKTDLEGMSNEELLRMLGD